MSERRVEHLNLCVVLETLETSNRYESIHCLRDAWNLRIYVLSKRRVETLNHESI